MKQLNWLVQLGSPLLGMPLLGMPLLSLSLVLVLLAQVRSIADDQVRPLVTKGPQADPQRVLASVGDSLITLADVDLALGRTASGRNDLKPVPVEVLMAAVEIVAQRRQALESLKKANKRISPAQLDQWLLENSPPDLKLTPTQALTARAEAAQVSTDNYREFLAFRLSWQNYLQSTLTEKNIDKHFSNQKARFDGTRFQVEHIWLPAPPGKSAARQAAHQQLADMRDQIVAGKMSMLEAGQTLIDPQASAEARQDAVKSFEPLWITGSGPLMPKIIDHVLKTKPGSVTEPFDSATAVHLVRVIKVEPGNRSAQDAQDDVRRHMLIFLLDYLAEKSADELPLVWLDK